jgi:putative PIN family toxin of toxin-antitoxin system
MRLVADTNTIATLLTELEDVFHRGKFLQRLQLVGADPHELILEYTALATIVRPVKLSTIIQDDPDDDAILSCAVAANAEAIISGDSHLLKLKVYQRFTSSPHGN